MLDFGDFSPLELNEKSLDVLGESTIILWVRMFFIFFIDFSFVVEIAKHIL
jgi:hypothetical protein